MTLESFFDKFIQGVVPFFYFYIIMSPFITLDIIAVFRKG